MTLAFKICPLKGWRLKVTEKTSPVMGADIIFDSSPGGIALAAGFVPERATITGCNSLNGPGAPDGCPATSETVTAVTSVAEIASMG
jgi:hypothetical protein